MANLVWLTAVMLGILPVAHHLVFGFRERRREILDYFDEQGVRLYYQRFFVAAAPKPDADALESLRDFYNQRFGRQTYVLPVAAYVITLIAAIALIVSITIGDVCFIKTPSTINSDETLRRWLAFALAGAYLWVVFDLLVRLRQRDIVPSTLAGGAFRFMISVPVALALKETTNLPAAVGFLLGVFPTSLLILILRRNVSKLLSINDDAGSDKSELEVIDGINTAIAEKLSDIGVTTILQLAYEDPIQLSMRLNLSFSYVLDLVSQALVAMYFSGNRYQDFKLVAKQGFRGAIEVADLYDSLNEKRAGNEQQKAQAKACAQAIIAAAANAINAAAANAMKFDPKNEWATSDIKPANLDIKTIEYVAYQVAVDPATELLVKLWTPPSVGKK